MRVVMILLAVVSMTQVADAQIFRGKLFGRGQAQTSNCPGGVCPTNQSYGTASSDLRQVHNQLHGGGEWTWPRNQSLAEHLLKEHGYAPSVASTSVSRQGPFRSYQASSYSASAPAVQSYGSTGSQVQSYGSTGSQARSYGSSGSLVIGQRLSDGAVVTSVGVTESSATANVQGLFGGGLSQQDRKFRDALLKAARSARDSGEINRLEYAALTIVSRNPAKLASMREAVQEVAIEEGMATATAIDWDALIAFIEKLIPLIIKLIGLFG